MMDWKLTQDAMKDFFHLGVGIPFVWEGEPRRLMRAPYGTLNLGVSKAVGKDIFDCIDGSVSGERELTLTCQLFSRSQVPGSDARFFANLARASLANPEKMQKLKRAGLVLVEVFSTMNLDAITAQRKESRAAFDVIFSYRELFKAPGFTPTYFDKVEISHEP